MKLPPMPFTAQAWGEVPAVEYPGETGTSQWRTVESGGLRVRVVDYGPGYLADHWCDRGHVLYVVEGTAVVELRDGREVALPAGSGFQVSDHGDAAHRMRTAGGCRVFIVD
jgi:quercetin dioxygenase-like cupin family protein